VAYLIGRTQVVNCNGKLSQTAEINTNIVQRSGVGFTFCIMMESDYNL